MTFPAFGGLLGGTPDRSSYSYEYRHEPLRQQASFGELVVVTVIVLLFVVGPVLLCCFCAVREEMKKKARS